MAKLEYVNSDGATDWASVADAEGNVVTAGTSLSAGEWYTVTIDLTNLGASLYICAATGAPYYVCDFAVTAVA